MPFGQVPGEASDVLTLAIRLQQKGEPSVNSVAPPDWASSVDVSLPRTDLLRRFTLYKCESWMRK